MVWENVEQIQGGRTHTRSCRPLRLITVSDHYIPPTAAQHYITLHYARYSLTITSHLPPPNVTLHYITYSLTITYHLRPTLHYITPDIHWPLQPTHYIIHWKTSPLPLPSQFYILSYMLDSHGKEIPAAAAAAVSASTAAASAAVSNECKELERTVRAPQVLIVLWCFEQKGGWG